MLNIWPSIIFHYLGRLNFNVWNMNKILKNFFEEHSKWNNGSLRELLTSFSFTSEIHVQTQLTSKYISSASTSNSLLFQHRPIMYKYNFNFQIVFFFNIIVGFVLSNYVDNILQPNIVQTQKCYLTIFSGFQILLTLVSVLQF